MKTDVAFNTTTSSYSEFYFSVEIFHSYHDYCDNVDVDDDDDEGDDDEKVLFQMV